MRCAAPKAANLEIWSALVAGWGVEKDDEGVAAANVVLVVEFKLVEARTSPALRTVSEMSMDMETKIRGNTYLRRAAYIFYRGRGWVGVPCSLSCLSGILLLLSFVNFVVQFDQIGDAVGEETEGSPPLPEAHLDTEDFQCLRQAQVDA